jgi:OpgC protein
MAGRIPAPTSASAADVIVQDAPAASVLTPAVSLSSNERELRLDLFRGLALWLIFIDHVSPDLLTWFTIRNYGFSDAAEISIFISGYAAAFVYGRTMLKSGFVVASARILKRVWQIYAATKQSMRQKESKSGLLRCARNDVAPIPHARSLSRRAIRSIV